MEPVLKSVGPLSMAGVAELQFAFPWDGGRGVIQIGGMSASGASAKIGVIGWLNPEAAYQEIFEGALTSLDADGVYPFEAPAGYLKFAINLDDGHTLSVNSFFVIRTGPRS